MCRGRSTATTVVVGGNLTVVPDICVVHLVRRKNGVEPFRSFLASYLENSAGINHELLILYKGFSRKADIAPYEKAIIGENLIND